MDLDRPVKSEVKVTGPAEAIGWVLLLILVVCSPAIVWWVWMTLVLSP